MACTPEFSGDDVKKLGITGIGIKQLLALWKQIFYRTCITEKEFYIKFAQEIKKINLIDFQHYQEFIAIGQPSKSENEQKLIRKGINDILNIGKQLENNSILIYIPEEIQWMSQFNSSIVKKIPENSKKMEFCKPLKLNNSKH